jgi:hypothetical protein
LGKTIRVIIQSHLVHGEERLRSQGEE